MKKFLLSSSALLVAFGVSVALAAWTGPAVAPPEGNTPPPLNVSALGQAKVGGLLLGTASDILNSLIIPFGKVGIATTSPSSLLKLAVNGALGAKQYCDENGNNCVPGRGGPTILPGASTGFVFLDNPPVLYNTSHGPTSELIDVSGYLNGFKPQVAIVRFYITPAYGSGHVFLYSSLPDGTKEKLVCATYGSNSPAGGQWCVNEVLQPLADGKFRVRNVDGTRQTQMDVALVGYLP